MAGRGRRTQWLSLLLSGAAAAAPPAPSAPPPATVAAAAAAADAELLLYLSEFEDARGEWIDPADLPPAPHESGDEDDER